MKRHFATSEARACRAPNIFHPPYFICSTCWGQVPPVAAAGLLLGQLRVTRPLFAVRNGLLAQEQPQPTTVHKIFPHLPPPAASTQPVWAGAATCMPHAPCRVGRAHSRDCAAGTPHTCRPPGACIAVPRPSGIANLPSSMSVHQVRIVGRGVDPSPPRPLPTSGPDKVCRPPEEAGGLFTALPLDGGVSPLGTGRRSTCKGPCTIASVVRVQQIELNPEPPFGATSTSTMLQKGYRSWDPPAARGWGQVHALGCRLGGSSKTVLLTRVIVVLQGWCHRQGPCTTVVPLLRSHCAKRTGRLGQPPCAPCDARPQTEHMQHRCSKADSSALISAQLRCMHCTPAPLTGSRGCSG